MEFKIEGEILIDDDPIKTIPTEVTPDYLNRLQWRTRDWSVVFIKDMADSHLRNAALFLIGMGVTPCYLPDPLRIMYLTLFRMEWERRQATRKFTWTDNQGIVKR